jgi:hypothetical protein
MVRRNLLFSSSDWKRDPQIQLLCVYEAKFFKETFGFKSDGVTKGWEAFHKDLNVIVLLLRHINGREWVRLRM